MSNKIQKVAYVFSFFALLGVAFFGFSTVASAQYSDEYYYADYSDGAYYADDYSDDYGSYDDDYYYGDSGYNPYSDSDSYYNDYSDYDYGYDDYCGNCDYGNNYDYGYNDCYNCDYGSNYNYDDCYSCYDYEYPDYAYCGSGCSSGSDDIIIDIVNENINTNTNVNINNHDNDNDDDEDEDEEFDLICVPSDRTVEEGERVEWRAEVDGVDEDDVDFEWSGDADGDGIEVTERYTREGTYRARVRAEYRGEVETATCTVEVEEEDDNDDDDRVTLVSTPPTGTPASLNSVYLSQVPYTGAAENAKLIGFITMLALSSIAGAYYIVTRKARADRKSFLERFKQENLASKA